jgi:hypothetical protein
MNFNSRQDVSRFEKEDFNGNATKKGNSMEENSTLEILKQAILLEKRGKDREQGCKGCF